MNKNILYTPRVMVERIKELHRRAQLSASDHVIESSVHSEIAVNYRDSPDVSTPRAVTRD